MRLNRSYRNNVTLLDATSTLIDAARAHCPANPHLERAIIRLEKRLEVLRARKVKANHRALLRAMEQFAEMHPKGMHGACPNCDNWISPEEFFEIVDITPGGRIRSLLCPHCEKVIL